jgi:uncharacterized protein
MQEFFPRGWSPYLTGGLLVGAGTAFIFLMTGIRAGASGVLSSTLGYLSSAAVFQRFREERNWRLVFTLGLIAGGAFWLLLAGDHRPTEVSWWRLGIGGFFVGLGTRAARGCTSGHGVCGLSSWSGPSLVHVGVFMGVAIAVAHLMELMM